MDWLIIFTRCVSTFVLIYIPSCTLGQDEVDQLMRNAKLMAVTVEAPLVSTRLYLFALSRRCKAKWTN